MKRFFTLLFAIVFSAQAFAGYFTRNFSFGGVTRQYLLYVPNSYDGTTPVPFVLALHGLGDNMNNFKNINLHLVADTANFIFTIPQALVDNLFTGGTAWNSGAGAFGISLNSNVNDVGFLNALIDTVSTNYNIDQKRIYSTGFSMGGFMSNRLACELNNRIAAIASVSGTIGNVLNCQPARAIPVAHFHGTADSTVLYSGNVFGNDAEALVAYWVNHNHCDAAPAAIDTFPNIANDNKVVVHYKYLNGDYGTRVEFFKVIGGAHEWLTAANDITYTVQIWRFFRTFTWEEQQVSGIDYFINENSISVFPNPANDFVNIQLPETKSSRWKISLFDLTGRKIFPTFTENTSENISLPLANLNAGVYTLQFENNGLRVSKKLVIAE